MTETTFPFIMEIPTGEVEMTSEEDVSQSGELFITKVRNCREFSTEQQHYLDVDLSRTWLSVEMS
jgi:hypothetical protein